MTSIELLSFLGIAVALTMMPGATTMLIVRSVITRGQSAGFFVILGSSVGVFLHATLSALGLSLILVQSAALFQVIRLLGAIYLVVLGVHSIWKGFRHHSGSPLVKDRPAAIPNGRARRQSLVEGLLTILLSPETSVFYLAVLPQFIHVGESILFKSFLLAGIHTLVRIGWYATITLFVGQVTRLFQHPRVRKWLEISSGVALILLGLKVATAK